MVESGTAAWTSILPVWILTVLGAVAVLTLTPEQDVLAWLGLCLGLAIVASLLAQLATRRPRGFVARITASIAGSILIVLAGTVIALLSTLSRSG
jgi:hypothetical protein